MAKCPSCIRGAPFIKLLSPAEINLNSLIGHLFKRDRKIRIVLGYIMNVFCFRNESD